MARPPTAQPVHHMRCLLLSDMGYSLRGIAQQLHADYPETFENVPSPDSVRQWIGKGRDTWDEVYGEGKDFDLMNAAKVRPQQVRRAMHFMAKLDQVCTTGNRKELDLLIDQIQTHAILEKQIGTVVGTDAPKVLRHQLEQTTPVVDARTAAAFDATPSPPVPIRRTS